MSWRIATAVLGLASIFASATGAEAAGSQRVLVSATIMPRMSLTAARHATAVNVTERDIARGFVEVASAAQFDLTSNTASHLEVAGGGDWFRTVRVIGLPGAPLELASMSRGVAMLPAFVRRHSANLSFHFALTPEARPGTYSWPISISLTALQP